MTTLGSEIGSLLHRVKERAETTKVARNGNPPTTSSKAEREEAPGRTDPKIAGWPEKMKRAGIPPRYIEAHLETNCQIYRDQERKVEALTMAEELAQNGVIEQRGRQRFCLVIRGDFGSGKTWLGTAAFKALLYEASSGLWTKYWDFIDDVQGSYSEGNTLRVRRKYQGAPVLMMDDLGDLKMDETTDRRMNLYKVLDCRNDHFRPTIITTNLSGQRLRGQFGDRTWERIKEMAALVNMEGKNLRDGGLGENYPKPCRS